MKDNNISKELSQIKASKASKVRMYNEILKATEEGKQKTRTVWVIPAIAAIVLAIVLLPQLINNDARTIPKETDMEISILDNHDKNNIDANETLHPNKPIIEGLNGTMNEEVPNPGEVYVSPTLEHEMSHYGADDVLFHVRISISYDITDEFTYHGKTMDEYRNEPIRKLYRNEYDKWKEEIYIPLDKEMTAAEQNGEEYAQGWEKHSPDELFEEYWYETQPEDVIAEYELACERYDKADKAFIAWKDSDAPKEITYELYETDSIRLNALGYDLEVNTENPEIFVELAGYLTRQQIEEFPASNEYGYIIMWADGENLINE